MDLPLVILLVFGRVLFAEGCGQVAELQRQLKFLLVAETRVGRMLFGIEDRRGAHGAGVPPEVRVALKASYLGDHQLEVVPRQRRGAGGAGGHEHPAEQGGADDSAPFHDATSRLTYRPFRRTAFRYETSRNANARSVIL